MAVVLTNFLTNSAINSAFYRDEEQAILVDTRKGVQSSEYLRIPDLRQVFSERLLY